MPAELGFFFFFLWGGYCSSVRRTQGMMDIRGKQRENEEREREAQWDETHER